MEHVNNYEQRRIEDKYLAHIKVTKCDQFKTLLIEETPDVQTMEATNRCYLMGESLTCVYLLICIMFEDNTKYTRTDPAMKVKAFFFMCSLPFVIMRVVAMICCRSPKTMIIQVFVIWLPNFILYAVWSVWALGSVFFMDSDQPINLALINMALLLITYSTSICGVFCGLPFFGYKIYQRINDEVAEINLKVW